MKYLKKSLCIIIAVAVFIANAPVIRASAASKISEPKITVKNTDMGVEVRWTKSTKATKYTVYRKLISSDKYTKIKTIKKSGAGSYVDTTAKSGKTYKYKVVAANRSASVQSNVKKIMCLSKPKMCLLVEKDCISVEMSGAVKGAKKVEVYRAKVKNGVIGSFKKVDTLNAKDDWDIYEDVDTENGIYLFKIRVVNGSYKSAFSEVGTADYIQAPWSYSNVGKDSTSVDVTWKIMKNVEGFRICRSVDGRSAKVIADIKKADCSLATKENYYVYTDKDVKEGHTYTYYVQAYSGYRVSGVEEAFAPVTFK